MDSPPPPYTRNSNTPLYSSDERLKALLRFFLVDSIAFLYQVDHNKLMAVLPPGLLSRRRHLNTQRQQGAPHQTILCDRERVHFEEIASTLVNTMTRARENKYSLITSEDLTKLKQTVVDPATDLNVDFRYVFDLLQLYNVHVGIERHKAGMHRRSHIPFRKWSLKPRSKMLKRVISDDALITAIAPNEATKVLLGTAVAEFRDRHVAMSSNQRALKRDYYCSAAAEAFGVFWENIDWDSGDWED